MRPKQRIEPTEPAQSPSCHDSSGVVDPNVRQLLEQHGLPVPDGIDSVDALATLLMDLFRRTGSKAAFEALIRLSHARLLRRVRSRTRFLGARVDAEELLQDAFINIYRYPDRFDASRPSAFKVWSAAIVDNAVRRHLRRAGSGLDLRYHPIELLVQEPDLQHRGPGDQAIETETCERLAGAYRVFLSLYLGAYQELTERERFVLQMVEVRGMRYAELAASLALRPEALKMVVFRARKRIFGRIAGLLGAVAVDAELPRHAARNARGAPRAVRHRRQPCAVAC